MTSNEHYTEDQSENSGWYDPEIIEAQAEIRKLFDSVSPPFLEVDPAVFADEYAMHQIRRGEFAFWNNGNLEGFEKADAFADDFYCSRRTTNYSGPLLPRPNLYGTKLFRGMVSALVGHGGSSKSSLAMAEIMAMSCGKELLHDVPIETLRCLYLNYEDPLTEMSLRVAAAMKIHNLTPADFWEDVRDEQQSRLTYISGRDVPLLLADAQNRRPRIIPENFAALAWAIHRLKADVLVIDPLVSAHLLDENDNGAVDMLIKQLNLLASRLNIAILVVHHSRKAKAGGEDDHADAARGASSFIDAVRGSRRVERMSADDAKNLGIPEDQRHLYFKTTSAKSNFSRVGEAEWYRLELPTVAANVDPLRPDGSVVAVATPWQIPAGRSTSATGWKTDMTMIRAVQAVVRKAEAAGQPYQRDKSAKNSIVPHLYGPLGIDPSATKPAASTQVNERLSIWLADGWLLEVDVPTSGRRRKTVTVLSVDKEAVDPTAPTDIPDHLGE